MLQLKEIIDDKYRILDVLGQGGSGTVYLAENIRIGNLWAVKEIRHKGTLINPMDEAYIMGKLYHPALPRVFDIYRNSDSTLIVMEYFEGETLEQMIRQGNLPDEDLLMQWAVELCSVMMYLHNRKDGCIIYRDLKPGNIMVLPDNSIRLIDMGIAREYKEDTDTDTIYIGTRGFAAPEQFGNGQCDKRTDVYGFGATLYSLSSGLLPDNKEFNPSGTGKGWQASSFLKKLVIKCTAQDPNNRFSCFEEILEVIQEETKKDRGSVRSNSNAVKERKLITVWDNAEFSAEMASVIAECIEGNVLLADFDLLDPKIDIYLGTKMYPVKNRSGISLSGIDLLMESLYKGLVSRESILDACIRTGAKSNLYFISGNFNMNNYEYFSNECLGKFLDKCMKFFDEVIINVNKFIYDSYTLLCLMASDMNIYAGKTDIASLRSLNAQIAFLDEKQKINSEKYKVVSWCEAKENMLPESLLKELSEYRYIGHISDNKRRNALRNDQKPFVKNLGKNVKKEYIRLLKKLGILNRRFGVLNTYAGIGAKDGVS